MKFIGQFFQDIGQFFQDDSTQRFSAIRLVLLAWAIGTLGIWGSISLNKTEIKDLPPSVQIVLLTLMTGKVVQKFGEKSSTSESDEVEESNSQADSTEQDASALDANQTNSSENGQVKNGQNPDPGKREVTPATT